MWTCVCGSVTTLPVDTATSLWENKEWEEIRSSNMWGWWYKLHGEKRQTGRVKIKINGSTSPDYCVFTHHRTAHAPVSELWTKEVMMFLHFQAFLCAGSGVGRNLTIVFSSLKEHADPPVTRSVDFKSITSLQHRALSPEFTSNPTCSCVQLGEHQLR